MDRLVAMGASLEQSTVLLFSSCGCVLVVAAAAAAAAVFIHLYFTRQRRYSDDVVNTNKDYKTYYPLFSMVSTPVQIEYTEYYYAVCR